MQNRFTHCKEKYKLLVNLKVQSFFVLFCCGLWLLSQIKEKGDTTVLKMSKAVLGSLLCMKQCKGVVCWKPLVGATSFSLVRERCREASETECSHEPGVILAFPTASGENPQLWIQHHPINITQLSADKLQASAERKNCIAITTGVWR